MRMRLPRLGKLDSLEQRTVVLGLLALGTVGAVAFGEIGRLWRRRVVVEEPEGAPEVIQQGALAALDTVEVAREGYKEATPGETIVFNLLSAFVISSSAIRLSAYGSRRGVRPFFDVIVGRTHVHHFIPGILLAFGSGAAALFARDEQLKESLAIPLGIGMGLTFDESALLLQLEDVYWSRRGLLGVQITLGMASLLAAAVLALRLLRRGERTLEEREEIPPPVRVRDPFAG
jgi:hypothetical protein